MHNSNILKHSLSLLGLILFATLLTACGGPKNKDINGPNTIRVGVIAGAEQKFMEVVKEVAAKNYDLNIQLISYNYFAELNKALADKEIDANVFQHRFYLEYSQKKYGYHFSKIGQTYIYPMGVYSAKIKNILQLPKGAIIVVPNEPTNEARALILLDKAGLIRMKSHENMNADIDDIAANPHNLQILRLPAREIPGMIPNVDIVVLNMGSYTFPHDLISSQAPLVRETGAPTYANIVVARQGEEHDPRLQALIEVLHSSRVQRAAEQLFYGQAIPAWK